ncbi:hypothetical protein COHA_005638 [Chlorella ohadii]|uniref:BTB domain-containing protein n=1 Tax=Chlorella ohadii TaxID=2649997 RepID=A0AAD5DQW2_9CHLO|nr:hypothetical protein COHA_005638 [Chlorella ohadii]
MPGTSHLPPFEAYNDDDPVAFYLSENVRTELEEGADAVFLCEGRALPVHSAVLSVASGALRDFFDSQTAQQANGNGNGIHHGLASAAHLGSLYHLSSSGVNLDVVCADTLPSSTERSLEGFTLKRLAHFLRFTYHPDEVGRVDYLLPGAARTLSACARLAHRLRMEVLLERLDLRMEAAVGSHQATLQRLMDWTQVAEECGLKRLWTKCIREICVTLSRGKKGVGPRTTSSKDLQGALAAVPPPSDNMHTAVHDVALLKDLSLKAKLSIMATLLASLRRQPGDPSELVPPEACLASALPAMPLPPLPELEMEQ